MRLLISADLERILKKRSFIVMLIIVLIYTVLNIIFFANEKVSASGFISLMNSNIFAPHIVALLIGLPVFLAVGADEISSNSMQAIIGRGVSRGRMIIAKVIDCLILITMIYALLSVIAFVSEAVLGAGLSGTQKLHLLARAAIADLRTFGATVMAMAVLFITYNIALGVIADICALTIVYLILEMTSALTGVDIAGYSFTGMMERANDMIVSGVFPYQIPIALLIFCVIPITAAIIIFSRKELDF